MRVDPLDYLRFDRRTLGLSRILLGVLLLGDLFHRGRWWFELYSREGVMGAVGPQNNEFSIFYAFGTRGELRVLFAVMALTFACLLVGYRTKLMQVLALVFLDGMNTRVLPIEIGGYVIESLLLVWTLFLPLGDRFSVDALLESFRRERESSAEELADRVRGPSAAPFVTLASLAVMLQLALLYYESWAHKTGPGWRDGHAIHSTLYCNRITSPFGVFLRERLPPWLDAVFSHGTLILEGSLPIVLLFPLWRVWMRRLAIAMIVTLHTFIGVVLHFGPFSWALCVYASLLISSADWEIAIAAMRRTSRARTVIFDAGSARAMFLCRLLKRLDRFELLTFEAGEAGRMGIRLQEDVGPAETAAQIVSALPLGPIAAPLLRLPGLRQIADRALEALARLPARPASVIFVHAQTSPLAPLPSGEGNNASFSPLPTGRGAGGEVCGRSRTIGNHARSSSRIYAVLRELGVVLMLATAVDYVLAVSPLVPKRWKLPLVEPFRGITAKARLAQNWPIMAPNPVANDGITVVDAVTIDGRHVDPMSLHREPFELRAPDFDLPHARGLGFEQVWIDYLARVPAPWFEKTYKGALEDYLFRLPQRTGHPEDALVSADVYWVSATNPRWNETQYSDYDKRLIYSFKR